MNFDGDHNLLTCLLSENLQLKAELGTSEQRVQELTAELRSFNDVIEQLQATVAANTAQIAALSKSNAALSRSNEELRIGRLTQTTERDSDDDFVKVEV